DVVGRLFREFAVTLAITILISAVVSLTLVPMMSGRWLKSHANDAPGSIGARIQRGFDKVIHHYDRSLIWVFDHQGLTLLIALATLVLTALLYILIPKGLFPTQDTGQLQVRIETSQAVSYARMADLQQEAARVLLKDPDVQSLSSVVGVDAANNSMLYTGHMLINLKKSHDKQEEIMTRMRRNVSAIPGV